MKAVCVSRNITVLHQNINKSLENLSAYGREIFCKSEANRSCVDMLFIYIYSEFNFTKKLEIRYYIIYNIFCIIIFES